MTTTDQMNREEIERLLTQNKDATHEEVRVVRKFIEASADNFRAIQGAPFDNWLRRNRDTINEMQKELGKC